MSELQTCCWDRIVEPGTPGDPAYPAMPYVCTMPKGHVGDVHEHREDFGVLARWISRGEDRRFVIDPFDVAEAECENCGVVDRPLDRGHCAACVCPRCKRTAAECGESMAGSLCYGCEDDPEDNPFVFLSKHPTEQVKTLNEQNTSLQAAMSAMANASLSRTVRAFHLKFGHPVRWTPEVPSADELSFRLRLVTEEFLEFLAAAGVALAEGDAYNLRASISDALLEPDFPALVDALGDLEYVIEGTRAVCGVDGKPIAAEIHRANLAKEPVLDKDGKPEPFTKPTKPEGWTPPDIEGCLVKQGWKRAMRGAQTKERR